MRISWIIGAAAAALLAAPAWAADLAVKAKAPPIAQVYSWTGFYVGGNVGYGWGRDTGGLWDSWTDVPGQPWTAYFAAGGNVLPGVKPQGVLGGGQVGYNWQAANWVFGLVADIQASDMSASASNTVFPPAFVGSTQSNTSKIDWFGTVRGRVGYAANNWLFYGTGGLAYGEVKSTLTFNCFGCGSQSVFVGTTNATNVGWAAGAGVEVGLTPHWTLGVEYLHIDLGSISTTTQWVAGNAVFLATHTANSAFAADMVRGMINYKF